MSFFTLPSLSFLLLVFVAFTDKSILYCQVSFLFKIISLWSLSGVSLSCLLCCSVVVVVVVDNIWWCCRCDWQVRGRYCNVRLILINFWFVFVFFFKLTVALKSIFAPDPRTFCRLWPELKLASWFSHHDRIINISLFLPSFLLAHVNKRQWRHCDCFA